MKRIFIIAVLLLALTLSACSQYDPLKGKEITGSETVMYHSFEKSIDNATNILKGKCVSAQNNKREVIYEFDVVEQYKGDTTAKKIYVESERILVGVADKNYSFTDPDYSVGEEYLLLLARHISVYYDNDIYHLVSSRPYIPLNGEEKIVIYGNERLSGHSELSFFKSQKPEKVIEYTKNVISNSQNADGVEYYGDPYIESTDLEDVVSKSEYVVKLIPTSKKDNPSNSVTGYYVCSVVETYKGDTETNEIMVELRLDSVKLKQEYIIALSRISDSNSYRISSKNSIYDTSELDTILQYID
ncbi:MAG: hypothetical protein E7641_00120 [Ruminococcaceae bacterium]|nr:hypothetical protein [Oscillospiraceae bacterium]